MLYLQQHRGAKLLGSSYKPYRRFVSSLCVAQQSGRGGPTTTLGVRGALLPAQTSRSLMSRPPNR
jgi:hypothetical protein